MGRITLSVLAMLLSAAALGALVALPPLMIHGGRGTFRGNRLVVALSGYVYVLALLVSKDLLDGPPDNHFLSLMLSIALGGGGSVILMLRRYGFYQRLRKSVSDKDQRDERG